MQVFDFVKHLHDECIRLSEGFVFDKKHPRHLNLVALYGTMIELTGSLVTVIQRKHRTGVPPIFRSILEAYVELKNLHEKAEYGYHMDASYHEQWIKILKEARNKPNPYLKAISEIGDLGNQIQEHEKVLADLKKRGYTPLKVFQRFERAGMEEEYRSLYNFLSNDAHSNIRALVDRHLEIHQNNFTVVFYKDEPVEDFLTYLDSVAGLLTDASVRIHGFFETGSIGEIEGLSEELNEIRSHY
jgi:hypothetical protein